MRVAIIAQILQCWDVISVKITSPKINMVIVRIQNAQKAVLNVMMLIIASFVLQVTFIITNEQLDIAKFNVLLNI